METDLEDTWIANFLGTKGNEYFCEVDPEFILDRFNLTGLNADVPNIHDAIDVVTGSSDVNMDGLNAEEEQQLDASARHLYCLVHARFILTTRGLYKMMLKYQEGDFGRCPRALCRSHILLPIGLQDVPNISSVKLYCPKCEDIYNPKSSRHANIDGAYFGTSFPGMFFQVYPKLLPRHSEEQFCLKIFGFKIHDHAEHCRWQQKQRDELEKRIADKPTS